MELVKALNTYVADLAVLNIKLHNLHWNVVGPRFVPLHEYTEGLYNEVFEKFDDVAEQVKILGETPVSTAREYLDITGITEVAPKAFSPEEVLSLVEGDLKYLKEKALSIRKVAEEDDRFTVVAQMEEHVASFEKHLWFVRSMQH